MAAQPPDLLDKLEQATIRTNLTLIKAIIEEIRVHDDATASELALLADDFEYGEIRELIEYARDL